MKYKYKISVVIPIYNVEDYLDETIESVINQTIGFENNIQLILVNDGSTDNSESICLKYKEKYPNNVIYIKQKNQGVSTARNNGMKHIKGKYVNFFDSDDIWDKDAFEKGIKMLENHKEIDIVSFRIKNFEALNNYHPLDYRFTGDRIIDIKEEYNAIQLQSATTIIRASAIDGMKFDKRIKYSEDAVLVTEIILNKGKYGIISSSLYNYRKRLSSNSAIQTKSKDKSWYKETPELAYKKCYDLSKEKYGKIIKYIQYYILYDYKWRFLEDDYGVLNEKQKKSYFNISKKLLNEIDDDVIINHDNLTADYKKYLLQLKYKNNFDKHLNYKDGTYYFDNYRLYCIDNKSVLQINNFKLKGNKLFLLGQVNSILNKYKIVINVNGKEKEIKLFKTKKNVRKAFEEILYTNQGFKETIEFNNNTDIYFYIYFNGEKKKLIPRFTTQAKLSSDLPTSFKYNKYMITCKNGIIRFRKFHLPFHIFNQIKLLTIMLKEGHVKQFVYRIMYYIYKLFNWKDIWLVSDRPGVANDNGMHLFKYINTQKPNAKVYFVLNKNSNDYDKMKQFGKIIPYGSFKYKMYFLLSKNIISSQADSWVYNAFGRNEKYYHDLYKFNFIFLQHGITLHNISSWLNAFDKDMSIFITGAKKEYDSIVNNPDFVYDEEVVKLTGFARYDNLKSDSKKQIAIMPTWRRNLAAEIVKETGTRAYSPEFKKSEYFCYYNKLINDERVLNIMRKKGYIGIFVIHPSHVENYIDFNGNDVFKINRGFADYQKIFKESSLLISDYSSVLFDFAYMHKPILYTQFDKDTFFSNHIYEDGYFKEERDGFGPLVYNYEDTIKEIVSIIDNDCKMDKKYQERVNNFFKYTDTNNCERIYNEILKLE